MRARFVSMFGVWLLSVVLAGEASAAIVTRCGASQGHSFYFESDLLPKEKAGWQADSISSGSIQLLQDGENFDLVYTDAVGTRSMRGDGFTLLAIPQNAPNFTLILAWHSGTGVVEHHLFKLDEGGNGVVVWGTINSGAGLLEKSGLYQAHCTAP